MWKWEKIQKMLWKQSINFMKEGQGHGRNWYKKGKVKGLKRNCRRIRRFTLT